MKMAQTKQNGVALVVGLVMLLVMTLIGVMSLSTTRTELKIANNFRNHSNAFQTAALMFERALVTPALAETWKSNSTTAVPVSYTSDNGLKGGTANVVFIGCRVASSSSLTGRAGKNLVHEVAVSGSELNSAAAVIAMSRQVAGFKTLAAGCED